MLSTTKSRSPGLSAASSSLFSHHFAASMCKRPAVSVPANYVVRLQHRLGQRAFCNGDRRLPDVAGRKQQLRARMSLQKASAGRYTSVLTINTFLFCFLDEPTRELWPVVVLPAPWSLRA